MKIIKTYYLPWLIMFGFIFGIRACTDLVGYGIEDGRKEGVFYLTLLLITGPTLFLGTAIFYVNKIWGPKKLQKNLSREPFFSLKKIGFVQVDNSFRGEYQGYSFVIKYSWLGGEGMSQAIHVFGFFKPFEHNYLLSEETYTQLTTKYQDEKLGWWHGTVTKSLSYSFRRPSFEQLEAGMRNVVAILNEEKLKPIGLEEYENLDLKSAIEDSKNRKSLKEIKDYKKPWIARFGWLLILPLLFWPLRAISIYRSTFIDYRLLFIPPLVLGLLFLGAGIAFFRHYKIKKSDIWVTSLIVGASSGYCGFLELNSRVTDKNMKVFQVPIKERGKFGEKDEPYLYIEHEGFYKQVVFPASYREEIQHADSLLFGTERGLFGYDVIKGVQLK